MTSAQRQTVLIAVMTAMLAVACAWSYGWMRDSRRGAALAAADLAECRRLAESIRSLRDTPALAASGEMEIRELGGRIEQAARRAGLGPDALEGIFPQNARRVDDSPYLSKPTALSLRDVTLGKLAEFLYYLTDGSGLSVRDLRIRVPHGAAGSESWDAEATVTYLIYSPPATARQ